MTTYHGDPIIDRVNPYEALTTALGFTPARVSERYRANNWLKNQERKIEVPAQEHHDRHRPVDQSRRRSDAGSRAPGRGMEREIPAHPITADGLRQSIASRQRMSRQTQGGVNLNPKLDRHLRDQLRRPCGDGWIASGADLLIGPV